jgi:hypothetical protein
MTDKPIPKPCELTPEAARQAAIYDALARAGITEIRLNYSGEGDSGCLEEPQAFAGGKTRPIPDEYVVITLKHQTYNAKLNRCTTTETTSEPMPLAEALHQWCYELLEEAFPGWEIDHGSYGNFIIDVSQRHGRIDHNYYDVHNDGSSF